MTLMSILAESQGGNYFALQGVARQLAPKRRRRRSYSSYFGTWRRKTTRRRKRSISLDDIFGQIPGTRR